MCVCRLLLIILLLLIFLLFLFLFHSSLFDLVCENRYVGHSPATSSFMVMVVNNDGCVCFLGTLSSWCACRPSSCLLHHCRCQTCKWWNNRNDDVPCSLPSCEESLTAQSWQLCCYINKIIPGTNWAMLRISYSSRDNWTLAWRMQTNPYNLPCRNQGPFFGKQQRCPWLDGYYLLAKRTQQIAG